MTTEYFVTLKIIFHLQRGYLTHFKNDLSQTGKLEKILVLIKVAWYFGLLVFRVVLLMTIIIKGNVTKRN